MNALDHLRRLEQLHSLERFQVQEAVGTRDLALALRPDWAELSPRHLQRVFGDQASPYGDRIHAAFREAMAAGNSVSAYLERAEAERQRWLIESGVAERLAAAQELDSLRAKPAVALPDTLARFLDEARRTAEIAQGFQLAAGLEAYRSPIDELTAGILRSDAALWSERRYLEAFNEASAVARLVGDPAGLGRGHFEAAMSFATATPPFSSAREYGQFLDAAGLVLPHWPRRLLLSRAEKRRRIRNRIRQAREPQHVRQAKSLVHRYESVLREIVDDAMTAHYGVDWAEERLPLCGCKDLLGRWRERGGVFVLEHADYHHYARIMTHGEHFADVFSLAFPDPDNLDQTIRRAGRLRADSHHARPFSPENLGELRVIWNLLEGAMAALVPDED